MYLGKRALPEQIDDFILRYRRHPPRPKSGGRLSEQEPPGAGRVVSFGTLSSDGRQLGRVLINAQAGGPLSGGRPERICSLRDLPVLDPFRTCGEHLVRSLPQGRSSDGNGSDPERSAGFAVNWPHQWRNGVD